MKVLWITNVLFPDVCAELKIEVPVVGGWMHSGAVMLQNNNHSIQLAVASLYTGTELRCIDKYDITYYLIPSNGGNQNYNHNLETYYKEIHENFKPDIIHIHGSEYPHSLAYVKACGEANVVVSIQGLVSICAKHYLGGIPEKNIKKNISIRDVIRNDSLLQQHKKMEQRGVYEIELLKEVKYVIGRTSWDLSNIWAINPSATYYFCNETLRSSFYKKQWNIDNCQKYSIFLSQAHYPIKGIQQVIKALPIILEHFPKTKVYVAGNNFITIPWYRKNGFAKYLEKLMQKNQVLKSTFIFLGSLNEYQMLEQYVSAHIFLCPSAIENSSNSLGEAQLVGTPCVASYVGGTMDIINDGETGFLYRFEETALLAKHICTLFNDNDLANSISGKSHLEAVKRHDKYINASRLNTIYTQINHETIFDL